MQRLRSSSSTNGASTPTPCRLQSRKGTSPERDHQGNTSRVVPPPRSKPGGECHEYLGEVSNQTDFAVQSPGGKIVFIEKKARRMTRKDFHCSGKAHESLSRRLIVEQEMLQRGLGFDRGDQPARERVVLLPLRDRGRRRALARCESAYSVLHR